MRKEVRTPYIIICFAVLNVMISANAGQLPVEVSPRLIIEEAAWVNKNSLMLKITNNSNEVITLPLEAGFPDYETSSNCLLLKIKKSNTEKYSVCGGRPMTDALRIPPRSSMAVIVQIESCSIDLQKNDEVEIEIDNTFVAVGLYGLNKNTIYKGLVRSNKIRIQEKLGL